MPSEDGRNCRSSDGHKIYGRVNQSVNSPIYLTKVERREEGEEGSARTLCSGLPLQVARQKRRARRAHARQPRTTFSSLFPLPLKKAVCFRYGSHSRSAVRGAPTRANHALISLPSSLKKSSGLPLRVARQKRRARRAHARQPRTTFSSLFPLPLKKSSGLPLRVACARRAHARQPRTTFSSLFPLPLKKAVCFRYVQPQAQKRNE